MNMATKIWLIVATFFILVGLIAFCGVMVMLKWDFSKLTTFKYQTKEYQIIENYENISITTNTADIVLLPSQSSEAKVVCYEQKNLEHSVYVNDGSLIIELDDTRKWYEHIGIGFSSPKITVYVPQVECGELTVKSSTGDVEIHNCFKFKSIDITVSTGDVNNYASASEGIKLSASTGDISVEDAFAKTIDISVSTGKITVEDLEAEGDVNITVSTGKTKLSNVKCKSLVSSGDTGDISLENVIAAGKFSVKRSTGRVNFDGCDATEIWVSTDTGDVKGTLLSEKVFITQSSTGKIDVPKTITGGICEISTSTGDIKIWLE